MVEVVTDDMPFLVDSVTMALTTRDRAIHVVIHPQLRVRRDVTGALHEVCDGDRVDDDEPDADARVVDAHRDRPRDAIRRQLDEIDGQLSASPARRPRGRRGLAQDERAGPRRSSRSSRRRRPPLDETEVDESRALLAWLADDHFTFLGYREYQLQDVDGEDVLRAVPGTGLGILRSDQDMSASYGKLPPAVAAKAREKQLLIITKANSRSTVHRPAYLDYVGIKKFDEQRRRRRRAPLPRAVQLGRVHREPDPHPGAAREGAPAARGCRLHPR